MSAAIEARAPKILVAGSELDAKWLDRLVDARIDLQLGLVGRSTLRFRDFGAELAEANIFALDKEVSLSGMDENVSYDLFSGSVTGVSLEYSDNQPELVVTVDDDARKLAYGTKAVAHLNVKMSDLVSAFATTCGLQSAVESLTTQHAYLLQSGTDLDFLNEICARTGRVWWVADGKLHFKAIEIASPAVKLTFAEGLLSFSVKATSLRPDKVDVVGWDPASQAAIMGSATKPATPAITLAEPFLAGVGSGTRSMVVRDAGPATADEATEIASALLSTVAADGVYARGRSVFSGLVALGATVEIAGVGPASGKYLVTGVEHVYDRTGFFTRFTAGPRRPRHLVDVLGGARPTNGFTLPGVLTGTVTNVADDENPGKVKVKYTSHDGTDVVSPYARVVSLGAGKGRGLEFSPEVGDEVLVVFEQGDSRRPLVLGGLFSTKNTLPPSPKAGNVANGKVAYRRITSREGHRIELADGDGPDTNHILISLYGETDHLRIGKDKAELKVSKELTITNGKAKIVFSEQGDITIQGATIKLDSDGNLDAKAKGKVAVEGTQGAQIKGMQVAVEAQTTAEVKGAAQLTLKGGVVMIN